MEGNTVNDTDAVGYSCGTLIDRLHGFDNLIDDLAAPLGHGAGGLCNLVGLLGIVGVLQDRRAQLLHGRSGLLEGRGLFLGTLAEVLITLRDLRRGGSDAF